MKYCINKHSNPDEAIFCRICGTQSFMSQKDVEKDKSEKDYKEPGNAISFTPDLYPDIAFDPESVTTADFTTIWSIIMPMPLCICLILSIFTGGGGFIFFTILFAIGELLSIIHSVKIKSIYRKNTDYIEAEEFIEGTRRIAKDGKLGLINENNRVLLESAYTEISVFDSSILLIKHDDKYGLYNLNDKSFVLSPKYDRISHFDNSNLQIESEGKQGLFNLNYSKFIVSVQYDDILIFDAKHYTLVSNSKKGLYSKSIHKIIVPVEYDEIGQFENQMCRAHKGMMTDHYDIFGILKR